ncbi:MAG: DUF308 domain-containing protein [Clostridiales bacterium]|nr:DUF308 domain-containing protein [Clostridiales bacterium]
METLLKKIKANAIVSALMCIILGIILVVWPGRTVRTVCMIIGFVLVVSGVNRLCTYIFGKDNSIYSRMNLITGVIVLLIGAWILFRPDQIIELIPVLVGIIVIIHGINDLQQTVTLCQSKYDKWWIALILGIITVGFGVLLIFNPFAAVETLVMFIGVFLIYDGVSDIWIVSRVSHVAKQMKQEMEALEVEGKEVK